MSRETQDLQADDTANPAMLWVLDGAALWTRTEGAAQRACSGCHGDTTRSMAGVAVRYPAIDAASGQAVDLGQRINLCRVRHQSASPLPAESHDLLALEALVARQSRGLPLPPLDDPALGPVIAAGRDLYWQRQGQLNLACASCHTLNWGAKLGSATIPQADVTGYPIYRLEWQSLGSLQRRLRNCLSGLRAEAYPFDAPELIALEAYLRAEAAGLISESPGVRP